MRFIWGKKQKTLNVGKIRKYDEEKVVFFRKKRVQLPKLHLYQIGKEQNMPVVAGRLVFELLSSGCDVKTTDVAAGNSGLI